MGFESSVGSNQLDNEETANNQDNTTDDNKQTNQDNQDNQNYQDNQHIQANSDSIANTTMTLTNVEFLKFTCGQINKNYAGPTGITTIFKFSSFDKRNCGQWSCWLVQNFCLF